ncbi:hypothetical protein C8R45DRAFT_923558 [Mycena sanguinolenta]|nr:hypothetical protein C8R45DRAFT_923558 [Mycena sanguinolenta]
MTNSEVLCGFTAVQSFPVLRNLTLSRLDDYDDEGGSIQPFGIHGAPALRHLSLECVLPSMMTMPWAQLTKMTLSSLPLSECLSALRWATSLHEFRRQGLSEEGEQSISEESSVHDSSLISLAISAFGKDEDILPLLTLPRLQRLELRGGFRVDQTDLDVDISDVQGPAWPESPGLGLAWAGSGFEFLMPKPKPSVRAWPGRAWA